MCVFIYNIYKIAHQCYLELGFGQFFSALMEIGGGTEIGMTKNFKPVFPYNLAASRHSIHYYKKILFKNKLLSLKKTKNFFFFSNE